jgi:hypothetical protein
MSLVQLGSDHEVLDEIATGEERLYLNGVPICRLVPRLTPAMFPVGMLSNIVMMTLNSSTFLILTLICRDRRRQSFNRVNNLCWRLNSLWRRAIFVGMRFDNLLSLTWREGMLME